MSRAYDQTAQQKRNTDVWLRTEIACERRAAQEEGEIA